MTYQPNSVMSGGKLIHGGLSATQNTTGTVLAAQDTFYQVTVFDTNAASNGITPDHTNDHLTIVTAGDYFVDISITAKSAQSNDYEFEVFKNNGATAITNLVVHRSTGVANAEGSAVISGTATFAVDDTIELWVERTDGGGVSKTITLTHVNMTLIKVA